MRAAVFAFALMFTASCGTQGALSSATPTASYAASRTPAVIAHVIAGVPPRAIPSPDGKWLAAMEPPSAGKVPYEPTVLLYDISGRFIARVVIGGGMYGWLPDSSGLYAATMLPQRAPPLAIIENDGRVTTTEIQVSDTVLSRDGKWLVSEQQENCCMNIVQRELRASPRTGGASRSLVMSASLDPQPVTLLAVDAQDRVVYRDGDSIRRIPLAGGSAETLVSDPSLAKIAPGATSPDGTAILVRGIEPARWYALANDHLSPIDAVKLAGTGPSPTAKGVSVPLWTGPHTVLVRTATGVASFDVATGATSALASITSADVVLAFGSGRLLVARGSKAIVIDASSGSEADANVDLGSDAAGVTASALPSGGFILGTVSATYRID